MSSLTTRQQNQIRHILGPARTYFGLQGRRSYSRDMGVTPPRMWPVSGRTVADGIVWPESALQVQQLVCFARDEGIPLVPRGGGTAASGGAVPANGGLIVDLTYLTGVTDVDAEYPEVEARAGTLWAELSTALERRGLGLRLYPTSARWSTVGGWLAQGGAGIGSFEFGWVDQNVTYVRLVGGDGQFHRLSGVELSAASEAQGTTGLITEVGLDVRPATESAQTLLSFPDAVSLAEAIGMATAREVPLWSLSFVNPTAADDINRMRYWRNTAGPGRAGLPMESYVATFAYAASECEIVTRALAEIARTTDAQFLSEGLARHEWSARFRPIRLAYSGGTVAPADVIVPTSHIASLLARLQARYGDTVAVEGMCVRGGETVVRAYLDPEAPEAGAGLGLRFALNVMDLAERYGGRGQSTGRYFGTRANTILGRTRVEWIQDARLWYDPAGILNPGKVVFNNTAVSRVTQLAAWASKYHPFRAGAEDPS